MKTSVEINGYTISIEESEGIISVNAIKDDEVVEEFTIQVEEGEEGQSESEFGQEDDIKKFDEFGDEEPDFGAEGGEMPEGEEDDEEDDEFESDDDEFESDDNDEEDDDDFESEDDEKRAPEGTLESFQSFINKKK